MGIISIEDLIKEANLGSSLEPAVLQPHIESAEIELKKLIGPDKFQLIEKFQVSESEEEKRIFNEVRKGGIYLALSYAVNSLNIETQGNGIVKIKGWNKSQSELMNQYEIDRMRSYFRNTAILFLQPHIVQEIIENGEIHLGNASMGAI